MVRLTDKGTTLGNNLGKYTMANGIKGSDMAMVCGRKLTKILIPGVTILMLENGDMGRLKGMVFIRGVTVINTKVSGRSA